jgi:hypothetical protein
LYVQSEVEAAVVEQTDRRTHEGRLQEMLLSDLAKFKAATKSVLDQPFSCFEVQLSSSITCTEASRQYNLFQLK